MSALWITHTEVHDPEAYAQYGKRAVEAITAHGGVFLARGGRYLQMEGTTRSRHVVVRFPTLEAAEACYRSAAYQEAHRFLDGGAAERDLFLIEESGENG